MIANPSKSLETIIDPFLIDQLINEELAHWSDRFGVTKVQLKSAINMVGPLVADVRAYLEKRKNRLM